MNRGTPGKLLQVYSDLFPDEWREVGEKLRVFDTEWFHAHPDIKIFVREYVPGESFPQHDPETRYVQVMRDGDTRVRAMLKSLPPHVPFVELPEELQETDDQETAEGNDA